MTLQTAAADGAEPSEEMMRFLRRNEEAVLAAADCALRVAPESHDQRVVVVLDMSEERSRRIMLAGVEAGMVPEAAVSAHVDAMALVVTATAARSLIEVMSGISTDKFDAAACYSSATRGMMLVVLSCGMTFVGCLPRRGAEIAKA